MIRLALRIVAWLVAIVSIITVAARHGSHNIAVLNAAGPISSKERQLMGIAVGLSIFVVVPVFVMLFLFAWRYREHSDTKKAYYSPNFASHKVLETIWWVVPIFIIGILSVITWTSSHDLDPYKPLVSSRPVLHVQVIALDWKWLFLYPDQHVATVNYLVIPTDRPVSFSITSDAPMNSFWIPQLGGQVYAMTGMTTSLQLMAAKPGNYYGSSANISGSGYAGMHFMTHAIGDAAFADWTSTTHTTGESLTISRYNELARPSSDEKPASFSGYDAELFNTIIHKYMGHDGMAMMGMQ